MKTDLFLKRLAVLRGHDLLDMLDLPIAQILDVSVRTLPTQTKALDMVFRLISPQGQEYLVIIEWQGYPDDAILWRVVTYIGLVGQEEPDLPIIGVIVYLKASDDRGDALTMVVDDVVQQHWPLRCIRLWELDAHAAVMSGNLALAILSPLMRGADAELVTQAAQRVLAEAPAPQQSDLLNILGTFAAPVMKPTRFLEIVTKEYLMSSELFEYLSQELVLQTRKDVEAEQAAKWQARLAEQEAALRAERDAREAALREAALREAALRAERDAREAALQEIRLRTERETLTSLIAVRFPDVSPTVAGLIEAITDPEALRAIRLGVLEVSDLATLEQQLREAVTAAA
jgi:hypothetical protein